MQSPITPQNVPGWLFPKAIRRDQAQYIIPNPPRDDCAASAPRTRTLFGSEATTPLYGGVAPQFQYTAVSANHDLEQVRGLSGM
jgi:hypothetical protein